MKVNLSSLYRRHSILNKLLTVPFVLAATFSASEIYAQSTWTGGVNSNWFENGNWDTGLAPNQITDDVIVSSGTPIAINGAVNINTLTVGAGTVLNFGGNFSFGGTATDTLTNDGTLNLFPNMTAQLRGNIQNSGSMTANYANNGALTSTYQVASSGATLSNGGTITLNGNNARITGLAGSVLTIADQTIAGGGKFGSDLVGIINSSAGLVDANQSGVMMTLDASDSGVVNDGIMQASNGGTLRIADSAVNNTNGSIVSQAGSFVELTSGTSITGGTFTGPGNFTATSSSLTDVTNSSTFDVGNNTTIGLTGNLNNTGNMTFTWSGGSVNSTLLVQEGTATLTGGGTINLNGNNGNNARISGLAGTSISIVDQTITGDGNIGSDAIGIINQTSGLINANTSGSILRVNADDSLGMVNNGIMQASNGGILNITDSAVNNTNGSIIAQTGSEVRISSGAAITGGVLTGPGIFTASGSSLTNVTNHSEFNVGGNTTIGLTGNLNNTADMSFTWSGGSVNSTLLVQEGTATLTGGGTITLNGNNGNSALFSGVAGTSLSIVDQTIFGNGNIGNNTIGIFNEVGGTIHANVFDKTMRVNPVGASTLLWTNDGTLRASNGGTLDLVHATQSNGLIDVMADSFVDAGYLANYGLVQGDGTIDATTFENNGTLTPGDSIGTLTINTNSANFGATSELLFQIAGTGAGEFDYLDVNLASLGKLSLDGQLMVDLNGFIPDAGDEFIILTASNNSNVDGNDILGSFANILNDGTLTTVGGEGYFTVNYGGIDGDGGQIRLSNFVSAVPEPSSAALLAVGVVAAVCRRRRRWFLVD